MKYATVLKTVTVYMALLFCCIQNQVVAQEFPEITRIKSAKLTEVLNNVEFVDRGRSSKYIVRVFKLHNGPGSAGANSGEVSYNLLIAISEIDESPEQSLFEMGSLLNPVINKWTKSEEAAIFTLEYGPYDKRKEVTLSVDLFQLKIINP